MMNEQQLLEFKNILKARHRLLREEIRAALLEADEQHFIDLAGQVHDLEDASLADLLVDLDLAVLDMQVEQVRDIDAALIRIAEGTYGICIDCESDITADRLHAYPTAKRCQPCQTAYERNHAGRNHPSL